MAKRKTMGGCLCGPVSENDWEAQNALRTMQEAERIKKDPGLMKRMTAEASKQIEATAAVIQSAPAPKGKKAAGKSSEPTISKLIRGK